MIPAGAMACKIDETVQSTEDAVRALGKKWAEHEDSIARAVIDAREVLTLGMYPMILRSVIGGDYLSFIAYAVEHPARRKRKPMDVPDMIQKWHAQVKKLALAHTVDDKDAASAALDEMLMPIVSAPVAQIREFYRGLTQALVDDPECPLALWKLFKMWGENVLDQVTEKRILELKTTIATDIAKRSMELIPVEDWVNSMIGALQWRSPEVLEEVKENLDKGHKPRVRGRESCLFLEVAGKEVML